jgi:coproporphyrinogen III oxidase
MLPVKTIFYNYLQSLQNEICAALENADTKEKFLEDRWDRPEGGGGISRVISNGDIFEKGGVNISSVFGELPQSMRDTFGVNGKNFYACGLSLVIHPLNPYVPTVHANWRYFELYDEAEKVIDRWFGGGSDLTPYYIFEEDGVHFHTTLKSAIQPYGEDLYQKYKEHCDRYFVNRHRNNEARGIGGVFYDYLRPADDTEAERLLEFQMSNGNHFLQAYLPIVEKRKNLPFGDREKFWQELRRGRYVEFNLVHDRGTLFGLKTNGRIESILMSLPPRARWEYNYQPAEGSKEEELLHYLKPRNWV